MYLLRFIETEGVTSIAVPPLGCGNGGLAWSDVRPLIEKHLGDLQEVRVEVYEPAGDFAADVAERPKLSLRHYVLASLRTRLQHPRRLGLQTSAYFFNVVIGETYSRFVDHKFGPYCPSIEPMIRQIIDYRALTKLSNEDLIADGIARALPGATADRLRKWLPALDRTAVYANRNHADLELLATLHAVIARTGPTTTEDAIIAFLNWSPEKHAAFVASDVLRGFRLLADDGLILPNLRGWCVAHEVPSSWTGADRYFETRLSKAALTGLDVWCATERMTSTEAIERLVTNNGGPITR